MPKGLNLKNFGRRKSAGTTLDVDPEPAPAASQSSFRVLERPDKRKSTPNALQERAVDRPFDSPLQNLRGQSVDNLGLGPNRGSAGTTNSGSSGYYDSSSASARYSSSSTLPSSLDPERTPDDEELFPPRSGMYQTVLPSAHEPPPPPPPSFSTRAARALSFGKQNGSKVGPSDVPPPVPAHYVPNGHPTSPIRTNSPPKERERALTTSSYASTSTAVPPKTELTLNATDFGNDDFGSLFDNLKKEPPLPPPPAAGGSHRTDSQPMYPPRTYSRQTLTPSPGAIMLAQSARDQNDSPYFSDRRNSNDGLMSSSTRSSPNIPDGAIPELSVGNGISKAFLGNAKSGYSLVPERYNSPGLERASIDSYSSVAGDEKDKETAFPRRQAQIDDGDRWTRRVELRDPQESTSSAPTRAGPSTRQPMGMQTTAGASRTAGISPNGSAGDSYERAESNTTTPRAVRGELRTVAEAGLFDSSSAGPSSTVIRPGLQRPDSSSTKKMTKAQFQALQRRAAINDDHSEEEDLSGEDYDDEDDYDRAKKMASQRRKQEANMSVYRQQMKKVTGGGPTDLPSSGASVRPSMDRGSSAPAVAGGVFHLGGIGGTPPPASVMGKPDDDEDDDVPLGILQAHGFPSSSKPPMRSGESDFGHQRRKSGAGSVAGGGAGQGNLPPFARRLPADPYFGSGLVNQSTRESLAFNSSGASVVGMPTGQMTPQAHPGGLVGVIAGEERARAARRGSPNPTTGTYNMPLPANMNMPQLPRTMSMGNVMPPQMYAGAPPMPQMMGMPQMPQMPQGMMDPSQQQMQQFMQMQMQFMQNMMAMQQAQLGQGGPQTPQPQAQQVNDYLGVNFNNLQRPMSMASHNSGFPLGGGRAMSMMSPPAGWSQAPQNGARPASAMPMAASTYAPSAAGLNLSGGGPGPGYTPSIAPSERSNVGMPTRYRPVTQYGEDGRTQSMTSSATLQAFAKQQTSPNLPGTPFNGNQAQTPKSTIRIVDKPKGAPKIDSRPVDDDEDDAWADMRKKRDEKKKSRWGLGRKDKTASTSTTATEPSLSELYKGLD